MTTNDGGPAFPLPGEYVTTGMSLRDWFAGQALAGIVNTYIGGLVYPEHGEDDGTQRLSLTSNRELMIDGGAGCAEIADDAYAIADAMIAEGKGGRTGT